VVEVAQAGVSLLCVPIFCGPIAALLQFLGLARAVCIDCDVALDALFHAP
jgi:hypothetical protein